MVKKAAIELGTSTIIVIAFALVVLIIMLFFANKYLGGTANQLSNYTNISIKIPEI